ncbi:hypothetical protein TL16_g06154 [Triparma laevis f. inornata]|uniref:Palmitoyltransferase n=1 Tax=Triparma laevis f. inornata TaxID=1714386 RepID=A0A9W7AJB2_9STRA|nr:hypothetical protein TL16_g06154 [Triparma laevis f. inornata]
MISGEVCITGCFLWGFYVSGDGGESSEIFLGIGPLVAYAVVFLARILVYVDLGLHDSSVGGLDFFCIKGRKFEDRYCSQCKKMVPGLDHHCSWLNTCVGSSNYGRFLSVVTLGIVTHGVHFVYAVYMLFVSEDGGWAGWWLCLGLAAVFVPSVLSLFGFHMYLLWVGMGTYDWMLKRRADRFNGGGGGKVKKVSAMRAMVDAY